MPDMSLGDFITHIAHASEELEHEKHEEHKALEEAAKLVEKEAKKEIGHYQDAAPVRRLG
jgi:hypothetical protein